MCNSPTVNHADVVKWFEDMRKRGFKIRQVGHDRKFCREYFIGMKQAGFKIVDQPQYYYKKSEGFRYIEQSAKNGALFICIRKRLNTAWKMYRPSKRPMT